jgi:hypothetical protein
MMTSLINEFDDFETMDEETDFFDLTEEELASQLMESELNRILSGRSRLKAFPVFN